MLGKILVFDTETTGFRSDDEVLTLAVVDGSGTTVIDGMYAPARKSAWPDAEKINRISPTMVMGCPTILSQRAELEQMFNDPDTLLVGYNIEFDIRLLGQSGIPTMLCLRSRSSARFPMHGAAVIVGGSSPSAQTITAMTGGQARHMGLSQIRLQRSIAIRKCKSQYMRSRVYFNLGWK